MRKKITINVTSPSSQWTELSSNRLGVQVLTEGTAIEIESGLNKIKIYDNAIRVVDAKGKISQLELVNE